MNKQKKISFKAIITAILALALVLCTFSACSGKSSDGKDSDSKETSETAKSEEADKNTGDIIEFGSYPQSKVTDSATISALDGIDKNWISYEYYSGANIEDADGSMTPSDYMKYADIAYNGVKYRAVTFSKYRPLFTVGKASASLEDTDTYQCDNGYEINNVYYFKYEPLKWRVLDASDGFIMCDSAIDSQAYNCFILYYDNGNDTDMDDYYGDPSKSYYANDWSNSSIRKWLNEDFYNTAFNSEEQTKIKETSLKTPNTEDSKYDSADTTDKIFLLSYDDVLNTSYGFDSDEESEDSAKQIKSTDYAQCQGCGTEIEDSDYRGFSYWWLRSPGLYYNAATIYEVGDIDDTNVHATCNGIVPALKLK